MNKKQKKVLIRVIVASVLLILCAVLPTTGYVRFATFMVPYLVIGYDILKKAWKGILNKQVFDENFLMAVATVGAILLGNHMTIDLVSNFFGYGSESGQRLVKLFRKEIFEEVAKSDLPGLIFTFVWAFNEESGLGLYF